MQPMHVACESDLVWNKMSCSVKRIPCSFNDSLQAHYKTKRKENMQVFTLSICSSFVVSRAGGSEFCGSKTGMCMKLSFLQSR